MTAYARALSKNLPDGQRIVVKRGVDVQELENNGADLRRIPAPSPSLFVSDWLDVLLHDPESGIYDVPVTADDLDERVAAIVSELFELELPDDLDFVMAVEALFARVIDRTNELRRLYRHHASTWPELPRLALPYDVAHVTFCVSTPSLARLSAEVPCESCEGCAMELDATLVDQLELDLAS